ncbi:hypothetical protein L7F22_018354 [Adiantum nelumboides]|nr:hypothetical protein [Adiantum nelumboides]
MQAMAHTKNAKNVDAQELRERERRSNNIVIRGIVEEKLETPPSLAIAIEEFFNTHFGMSGVMVYGAHRVGKQRASRSGQRPIVCTMVDVTKRKIILDNSWVYLKGMSCFVYEDRTLMQQNARRKAYEERSKRFKEQSHEEKTLEKEATPCNNIDELTNDSDIILLVETWEHDAQRILGDKPFLDLEEDIAYFKAKGEVIVFGDMNARTKALQHDIQQLDMPWVSKRSEDIHMYK